MGTVGATALGCTLPAATGTVGATPLRPAKTLDYSVGTGCAMGGVAKEATQTASRIVVSSVLVPVPPYREPPLVH